MLSALLLLICPRKAGGCAGCRAPSIANCEAGGSVRAGTKNKRDGSIEDSEMLGEDQVDRICGGGRTRFARMKNGEGRVGP